MADYSQQPKLYKLNSPFLMFQMQIDSGRCIIPGLNTGRLSLWDYELGCIWRWVATSSYNGRQNVSDWEKTGGLHPPNYVMDDAQWFRLRTKLITQPGAAVPEGYLPVYGENDSNTWVQLKGKTRSEIMWHEDERSPGSYGCIVFQKPEWEDFKRVFSATCGHLESVRYGVIYSF